jgi:hypothetical protein
MKFFLEKDKMFLSEQWQASQWTTNPSLMNNGKLSEQIKRRGPKENKANHSDINIRLLT